eukprot:m.6784 g.6784  ORF g.6784 m.6784 type:complete len:462 (-) comp2130_c0_seq1:296-1681(-)
MEALVPSDYSETVDGFTILPRRLGEGCFSKIFLARHTDIGEKVAAKMINKARLRDDTDRSHVTRSVQILQSLQHANICRVAWITETSAKVCVFLEHCEGGSMLDFLRRRGRLCEDEAKMYFMQTADALAYCHSRKIVHRNINLQNILIAYGGVVKLSSFGYANEFSRRQLLASMQESPHFVAPEIVLGSDALDEPSKVDVWAAGVVLFAMLCGKLPFIHPQMKTLCKLIVASPLVTPEYISEECVELLQGLLDKSAVHRFSMEDVLGHSWLAGVTSPAHGLPTEAEIDAGIADDLQDLGAPYTQTQPRSPKGKAALARLLLSIRYTRERDETIEVPHSIPSSPASRSPDSSFVEEDEDDDFIVPDYVPDAVPAAPAAAATIAVSAASAAAAGPVISEFLLEPCATRKRASTDSEDDALAGEAEMPSGASSPLRPITPFMGKRTRVSPLPEGAVTPGSADCW